MNLGTDAIASANSEVERRKLLTSAGFGQIDGRRVHLHSEGLLQRRDVTLSSLPRLPGDGSERRRIRRVRPPMSQPQISQQRPRGRRQRPEESERASSFSFSMTSSGPDCSSAVPTRGHGRREAAELLLLVFVRLVHLVDIARSLQGVENFFLQKAHFPIPRKRPRDHYDRRKVTGMMRRRGVRDRGLNGHLLRATKGWGDGKRH